MEQFNAVKEIFLSMLKWFLLVLVLNNVAWGVFFSYYVHKSFDAVPTEIEQHQSGHDNSQSIGK